MCPLGGGRVAAGGRTAVADVFGLSLNGVKTKKPGHLLMSGLPKNGGYLLSQLVGQYHRRW